MTMPSTEEVLAAKCEYLESRLMWNAGEVDRLLDENTRLKAQVTSLLTTLTQDTEIDPRILHADCRAW